MDNAHPTRLELMRLLPELSPSRLVQSPRLAARFGVARVLIKAECDRPLGNFKVLGGVLAAARALDRIRTAASASATTLLCASDGNHGLAVALAAQRLGVQARVYLPAHVAAFRAERIAALGARIEPVSGTYDDAVDAALRASKSGGGLLVADTADDAADPVVADVIQGYSLLSHEARSQWEALGQAAPSHAFVQAGVGGLAASVAQTLTHRSALAARPSPRMLVVEPERAACVRAGLLAAAPVRIPGDLATRADMLSCGVAAALALRVLQQAQAQAITVSESALSDAVTALSFELGTEVTPSAAAGLAGLAHCAADARLRTLHALDEHSAVLLVATEAATPQPRL